MSADVGDRAVISAVLLPTEADSQLLVSVSRQIADRTGSAVVLGEAALPHITLVQFFADPAEAPKLWEDVCHLQGQVTEATSTGLLFLPERTRDNTWVELSFFQSRALAKLRDAVLATPFAQQFSANNGDPNLFRPHVTLAMYPGKQVPALSLDEFSIFRRDFTGLRLAVGINGPNLSVTRIAAA